VFSGTNSAQGVLNRNNIKFGNNAVLPTAEIIIHEAKSLNGLSRSEKSCLILIVPNNVGLAESELIYQWKDALSNVWFHALMNSYASTTRQQGYMTVHVSYATNDERALVDEIERVFNPQSVCIFSTEGVVRALQERSSQWNTRVLTDFDLYPMQR
jgi:hypothetical protein